jgi:predicted component of type VI protein secretion system
MQDQTTFQLVMHRGPRPGQVFELPRSTVSIGRDPGNQVVINDPQISRQHARITPQGGLLILEDLGSTNGTTVNGLRIVGAHTLAHGDEIGLGDDVTLTFQGRPTPDAGTTVAAPRATYTSPTATAAPPTYATDAPAYEADYETYPEYYDDYPEEPERNWTLIGLGCIIVAIVVGLMIALYVYFLAPASIVDPIADFLAGFGISVP